MSISAKCGDGIISSSYSTRVSSLVYNAGFQKVLPEMEYNKQCRFRTIHHTRSQIDSSTWSYQHTTTRSCLIWNLHHTWSYRFRHLCCEELGSYQVEKVLVMCWQDQTKHKSPSRVCSHCIVVPQNTCKKWQKWSRVEKDHVWRDHVWSPTPVI